MVVYECVRVMNCAFLLQTALVVEGNSYLLCKYEINTFRAQTSRAHCPLQTQMKQLCRTALKKEMKNYKTKDTGERRGIKKEVKVKDEEVSR
jgi:hypothetical protein